MSAESVILVSHGIITCSMAEATLQFSWEEQEASLQGLPLDVWQLIIAHLDITDVIGFSLASKYWFKTAISLVEKISLDPSKVKHGAEIKPLWSKIATQATKLRSLIAGDLLSIETMVILSSATQLEEFDIRASSAAKHSPVTLLPHMTFLCRLQHLNLSWMRDVQSKDLIMLSKYLTSLRRITLSGLGLVTADALAGFSTSSKLTRLGLYGCTKLSPGLFDILPSAAPQLRHLSVRSISSFKSADFLSLRTCTNLTRLSVRNTNFDDSSCALFPHLCQLERISLASTLVKGHGLTSLQPLQNTLKWIDLIWCDRLRTFPMLAEWTQLQTLRLDTSGNLEEISRAQIEYLHGLTRLEVNNIGLSGELVRSWRNLTNLRSLDVGNNQLVHADDVLDLLSSLPNLKHIQCAGIHDAEKVTEPPASPEVPQ